MKIIPCIIGLGYVGLPITLNLSKKFLTYGFDINKERIESLKKKIDANNEFRSQKFGDLKRIIFTRETISITLRIPSKFKSPRVSVFPPLFSTRR